MTVTIGLQFASLIGDLRDQARSEYFEFMVNEEIRQTAFLTSGRERSAIECAATATALGRLGRALEAWFDVSPEALQVWLSPVNEKHDEMGETLDESEADEYADESGLDDESEDNPATESL